MDAKLRDFVRQRAGDRCEYCRIPQHAVDGRFQLDHIVARQHQDDDRSSNLALACARCNRHKGTNLSSIDPQTGAVVALFNPRSDDWAEHFHIRSAEIVGQTPAGRATARLLDMNAQHRVQLREALLANGEF